MNRMNWRSAVDTLAELGHAEKSQTVLWGLAPTGAMHLGYLSTLLLLRTLASRGWRVIVLLADYHAYLDSQKTAWSQIDERVKDYRGVLDRVPGLTVQETRPVYSSPQYIEGLLRSATTMPLSRLTEAGATTFGQREREQPTLAGALYVAMQVYDLEFFGVNVVVCGADEAPIYLTRLPTASGIQTRLVVLPMCPGILEPEMHSSGDPSNKVLLGEGLNGTIDALRRCAEDGQQYPLLMSYCAAELLPFSPRIGRHKAPHAGLPAEVLAVELHELIADLFDPKWRAVDDP